MNRPDDPPRIDRRLALKWIAGATASLSVTHRAPLSFGADAPRPGPVAAAGYGPDPDLIPVYKPGDLWSLTFSGRQRRVVITLCDIIIPADDQSPNASSLGVHDFIDEWISAPYPEQAKDRVLILKGLAWLDEEAARRGGPDFVSLEPEAQNAICRELAVAAKDDAKKYPGSFFLRMRNLIAGGYYTTPVGMKDLGYVGNIPSATFPGPPPEVLERLGLSLE